MDNTEKVFELDTSLLEPNPLQPRGLITPESLAELAESIREHGVLEPLVIAKTPAGYQIIAGERRWRAAKLVGLTAIPVVMRETSPQGMLEMAIVENVQRQDLNPLERAQAYKRLMDEFGLTNSEISQRVAKSPSYISNTVRLLTLPDALKDALMSGQTSEGHVRALSALEDPHLIVEAYKEVMRKNLSVRGAEELVRRMRAREGLGIRKHTRLDIVHLTNDELDQIQNDLVALLSTQIHDQNYTKNKVGVRYILTNTRAELRINLPGSPEQTNGVIKGIYEAISSRFGPAS